MNRFEYVRAKNPKHALELLAKGKGKAALLAGGTDLIPGWRREKCCFSRLVDLKPIEGLRGIKAQKTGVTLGPLTTLADLAESRLLARKLPVLVDTALGMASPQVRNRGTVGGNLCNAAPSADLAPPLIALGAKARVLTRKGSRTLPLEDFFTGPGETVLSGGKGLLTAVIVPFPLRGAKVSYRPLTLRQAMDLSMVSAAAAARKDKGKVKTARLVLGAVAPVPLRCVKAEARLIGSAGLAEDVEATAALAATESRPISDVRSSREYRKDMAREMMVRALREVLS